MGAVTEPTTQLSATGSAAAGGAVEALKEADGRGRLIEQVEVLLRESGNSEPFDAAAWVDRWLRRPNHALGGARPELYLNSHEGVALLTRLIGAMAAGSSM